MTFLSNPLLVPIHVDALAVGSQLPSDTMFQWSNLSPNFSTLQSDYHFGSELIGDGGGQTSLFDQAGGLETGIHLHFRLPRAFAHGRQQGDSALSFPVIPNRWLVQRFGGDPVKYKAWIIKSDAPAIESSGVPWPTFPKDEQQPVQFNLIGACTELTAALVEEEPARVNLTVVGQGNPMFSAYYPACRSVLGFHDPLTDVPAGSRLSYLVTSWFSAANDDPLHAAGWRTGTISAEAEGSFREKNNIPEGTALTVDQQSRLLWEAWLKDRQWRCDFDPKVEPPSRLLCHGLVRGITWHGAAWNYMQPSDAGASLSGPEVFPRNQDNYDNAYQVAVGNTGAEALAALLAKGDVDQDLLAALQDGLLGQPMTAAELQYELHGRRFEGVQGGTTFAIQPEPDYSRINDAGDLTQSSRGKSVVLPGPLAVLLSQLNEKQSQCDLLAREIEDCRWQVYALWYLWTTELKKGEDSARIARLESQLNTFKDVLNNKKSALDLARKDRDALCTPEPSTGKIIDELARYPKTGPDGSPRLNSAGNPELKYRLVRSTALPFYKPSEPVVAVSGPGMARLNTADALGPVGCRLPGQLVSGILLQVPGGANVTVTGQTLVDQLFSGQASVGLLEGANKSLLGEALLLDVQQAANIAGQASQQHRDELAKIVRALQDPQSAAAQSNPPPAPNALVGRLPDRIATFDWQRNPWIPLLLVWEVSWQSDYKSADGQLLPADLVTGRWLLDPLTGDLATNTGAANTDTTTYQGYSILTPSASRNLAQRLQALSDSHPLINTLENQNAQLQKLGGFNDALIQQQVGMQIPPLDFQKWFDSSSYFIDPIRAFINQGFSTSEQRARFRTVPDTSNSPFLPIRVGQLEITKLSLVDAFGQTLLLPVAQINDSADTNDSMLRAAHSCAAGVSSTNESAVTLRPRFAQPMRLQFQWANASDDTNTNGGPVCGWIVPNYLEKSLTVYDANGRPLGALQRKMGQVSGTGDKTAFYWLDVPGGQNGGVPATDLGQRLAKLIENTHLRRFCLWVLSLNPDMGAVFSDLISDALASADQRVPDEDPGLSVLIGRTLALVRANVQLETFGLPAHKPELRAATGTVLPDLIETRGFEKVKWPLRLGELGARNDGLIGVFRSLARTREDDVSASPFYPAWGQDKDIVSNNVKTFAAQDFSIDCVEPLQVTMLMDPQARVHATTGALPQTFFELPNETVTGAKRAREVVFQTAPVLGFSPTPAMPRPSDDYGEWSWVYRPDVTQWKLDPKLIDATDRGGFAGAWPTIAEGWLKLEIAPVKVLSFWLREPAETVTVGTRVHLAWSLQGAESLELVKVKADGKTVESIERWNAAPFPSEYGVVVNAKTTYRIIATAEDAGTDARDLTIKIAST